MTTGVDVYWSFRSPYSYLAAARLRALSAVCRIPIRPHIVRPIALRDPDFFERNDPRWIDYVRADAAREAERFGISYSWPNPDPVDQNIETRAINSEQPLMEWLGRLGAAANETGDAWAFIDEVSRLIWGGTSGWNQPSLIEAAVSRAGFEFGALEALASDQGPRFDAQLIANENAQHMAGHWGVPLMVYQGERFFGQDRIDSLEWRLRSLGLLQASLGDRHHRQKVTGLCDKVEQRIKPSPPKCINNLEQRSQSVDVVDLRGLSHVLGAGETPLSNDTIGEALAKTVRRWPDREALIVPHQKIRWTYRDLDNEVDALATGLMALGLHTGDRIGTWAPNRAEWVVTQIASARAGLILVTINPAYRLSELKHALNLSGCRALVTAQGFKSADFVAMMGILVPDIVNGTDSQVPALDFLIQLEGPLLAGALAYQDIIAQGRTLSKQRLIERAANLDSRDPINIQFTSGTTGAPKGATLTHRNILNNAILVGRQMKFTECDRLCIPVPLYHCFGMVMGVLNCVAHGSAMVLSGESFEAATVIQAVNAERCTALYGVPTMFVALLAHPASVPSGMATLRTGVMAGAPCPVNVMTSVIETMNMREITICYGMTETSPVSFQSAADAELLVRTSTVGNVHPHVEAKVVNDDGAMVHLGEVGELLVRGYSVMAGYWNDPDRTAAVIDDDGWMHTGDLATIDTLGRAKIVGRITDMIIRGGENIYPVEIEDFLSRHPAIIDAAVFGVPDMRLGEEVCAWIRACAPLAEQDVRNFCDGQIAHYKIPKHVRIVDSFPMTVTGKIQKFEMRSTMRCALGRDEIQTA